MIHNGKKTRIISIRFKLMLPVTAIMLIMALALASMGVVLSDQGCHSLEARRL